MPKKYPDSILSTQEGKCFLCGRVGPTEVHHIFGGPNRDLSTKYGLVVHLCVYCHNLGPNAVHNNVERMKKLRAIGQAEFEATYPDLDFLKIFGKNYL